MGYYLKKVFQIVTKRNQICWQIGLLNKKNDIIAAVLLMPLLNYWPSRYSISNNLKSTQLHYAELYI